MKSKYGAFIAIFLCVSLGFLPIAGFIKVILILAISLALLYINRSLYYFIVANRHFMNKKLENKDKTWQYYRKAYNANLVDKYKNTMANILIQKDDYNFGGIILDSVINNSKDSKLVSHAKIQKSMVYQLNGEIDKSIEILEEVKNSGYCDKNLLINLGTYVLYQGDLKKAEALIEESSDKEETSSGIADNHGWFYILSGNWKEAYKIYFDLLDRKPRFPDPYVHAAQVFLHYNNIEKAVDCLTQAVSKSWTNTIFFDQEILNQMIVNLESDKKDFFVACINASVSEVARGESYKVLSESEAKDILNRPFEKEPIIEEKVVEIDDDDDDNEENIEDEMPNTELTAEDLKWDEREKDETEEEYEVDEDENDDDSLSLEDESPNTDLTEEDLKWEKEHK